MINYGYLKTFNKEFDIVEKEITETLKTEGFGILTRADVGAKLKEKLNIDFKKYIILGACSPPDAFTAITGEENIGLLLPCNVILYENNGKVNVAVIKPTVAMSVVDNDKLPGLAQNIEDRLIRAVDSIK